MISGTGGGQKPHQLYFISTRCCCHTFFPTYLGRKQVHTKRRPILRMTDVKLKREEQTNVVTQRS